MTIYSRFGATVELLRQVATVDELPPTEERDALARERIHLGQWYFARLSHDGKPLEGERIVDLALCRADGGIHEITEAARKLAPVPDWYSRERDTLDEG